MHNKSLQLSITQGIECYLSRLAESSEKLNDFYSDISIEIDEEVSSLKHIINVIKNYAIEKDAQIEKIPPIEIIGLSGALLNGVTKLEILINTKEKASYLLDNIKEAEITGGNNEN
ncbi:hypothetical protein EGB40_03735 [Pasteurella multocida]|uniref:hypothetical protein n=1 Tax=Pasteurella multocida TaxID=747 RepID=UPI00135CDDF3|nr:hypothetical protein [Pasteurella multocida]NAT88460.1 hypothetical protein [Pasteurella multocida]